MIKNGKAKEYYDNGQLSFEGEYLDGKRSGKGKEYNNDGEILFEGEYLDGNRWNDKCIEYNENYDFQFEGEKWNGVIIEYDLDDNSIIFNGNIFEGEKIENN